MVNGAPFQPAVPISAADINKKTLSHTSSLSTEVKLPGSVWINLVNNGAFKKNDIVAWNVDGDGYVYLTMAKHTHDDDTNASGGSLKDIFAKNLTKFLYFAKRVGVSVNDFMSMGTGGSAGLDHPSGAIKMDTSTGSGNFRNLHLMGIPITFTKYSVAETDMQFTGNTTNQFCRWGFGMEALDVTNNSDEKYGVESCAATNGNWFIVTADGDSRTQQDSLKPLLGGGAQKTYRIENNVGVSVDFTYSTDSAVSKITNLPTDDSAPKNNIVNYGIKTSDTNSKQLYIWGLAVVGER
ncbi:MAG: hypothetical protein R2685_07780 [Candidatus Nitrosocosmicus sp.]|nr:hypothetical protein [Candidatus Nitrosocosmicus sp.]